MTIENPEVEQTLISSFKSICGYSASYSNSKGAIRSSSPEGIIITKSLLSLGKQISAILNLEQRKLLIEISRGASNVPRVFYIAVVKQVNQLSTNPSVSILFDEFGRGIVYGLMRSRKFERTSNTTVTLSIDSEKSKIKYAKLLASAEEQKIESIEPSRLLAHLSFLIQKEFDC